MPRTDVKVKVNASADDSPRRMICAGCGARVWMSPGEERPCGECGAPFRAMGLLEGFVDRWFAPAPQQAALFYARHRKLIELMWTADGRGLETYEALALEKVSYGQFVRRATELVERGLVEGWVVAKLPPAPSPVDEEYQIHFVDPDRWADELTALFLGQTGATAPPVASEAG